MSLPRGSEIYPASSTPRQTPAEALDAWRTAWAIALATLPLVGPNAGLDRTVTERTVLDLAARLRAAGVPVGAARSYNGLATLVTGLAGPDAHALIIEARTVDGVPRLRILGEVADASPAPRPLDPFREVIDEAGSGPAFDLAIERVERGRPIDAFRERMRRGGAVCAHGRRIGDCEACALAAHQRRGKR